MSAPVVTKKARRDYGKDAKGVKRPGVTTVLGQTLGWSKDALMWWAARCAATACARYISEGATYEDAADRARKAHVAERDAAAEAGTLAHLYVETYLRTGASPPEDLFGEEDETQKKARRAFDKFVAWWATAGYEVVSCELALVDDTCDYGGTVDYVLRRKSDGALVVADLKTGKSVYDEVLVQLGAYALLLDKHKTVVDAGLVIHMPVDGDWHSIPIAKDVLALGGTAFAALLLVHKSRSTLKINLDTLGGTP